MISLALKVKLQKVYLRDLTVLKFETYRIQTSI